MSESSFKRSNSWPLVAFFSILVLVALVVSMRSKDGKRSGKSVITVYCAAGVRLAVEEVAKQFEQELGVKVALEYASSGVLANRLKTDREGGLASADVYIPADYQFTNRALADGLTTEAFRVARWKVVLGVKPGLDLDLSNCDDLLSRGISFVMCDPLTGVGKKTRKMLVKSGHWTSVDSAKASSFPTVTEAALAVKENAGTQAAFIWNSTARQHGLRVVDLPELADSSADISVAVTASTENPTLALQFARYLAAPQKGGLVFARHKYISIAGDAWAERPKLRIDCGGVNREAVEKTISEFEEREGCEVDVVYAGCGTLVSKMRTGEQGLPDLFVTCDATYLTKAQSAMGNPFGPDLKVSSTRIVMLVGKGNPKGLHSLSDLDQEGLRIGTTDPDASTLGALSHELIRETGKFDVIQENIEMMADTAHTLIQTMEAGEKLDVVLVYEANIQHLNERFATVPLQAERAVAVQNVAARKDTPYPQLTERLMLQLVSDTSRRRFEQLGFSWVAGSE
jgi:molybdate transport system substrate-binding protein